MRISRLIKFDMETQNIFEFIILAFAACLVGHNLWLVEKDEMKIEVVTSDKFPESDSAVKPERITDFRAFTKDGEFKLQDYETTETALIANLKIKANLVALELNPHPIVLEAEKFAGYIKSELAENFTGASFDRPQRESYAKFAKVLLDNDSFGKIIGQKFEIVLLSKPKSGENLTVKILFDGEPVNGLRVSAGAENLNGGKYFAHSRTDANGAADIEISGGGLWFVRTHFIRPHTDTAEFNWESFWASVTFRV